jgi:predicted ATPase/class 3 adenylate cyclase
VSQAQWTFLFTDIESSTQLWEIDAEAMAEAVRRHEGVIAGIVESHGGRVFKSVGDQQCARFGENAGALDAALEIQGAMAAEKWGTAWPLAVRIGIHCGSCEERDGDYFGPTVNKVARIEDSAHGGQVVCSESIAVAAGDTRASLRPLGTFVLGGIRDPERLFQVESDGQFLEFPPLRVPSVSAFSDNLPSEVSSFVGREAEIGELEATLTTARLVTLAGVGGVGKTRLAVKLARRLAGSFAEGVWLVDLSSVTLDDSVASAVSTSLDLARGPDSTPLDAVIAALGDQQRLIIFDNCEEVVAGSAHVIGQILARCPRVIVLATSREPLEVEGEFVRRVAPLPVPEAWHDTSEALMASPAVRLFADRARAREPGFEISDGEAPALARLCRELDGIPLAIELAAAWIPTLTVSQLSVRIAEQLAISGRGRRDRDNRQRTMRAVMEWSVAQLDPLGRSAFLALGVFDGPFSLDAATDVTGLESHEVLETLGELVERSLVDAIQGHDETYFSLISSLRAFARDEAAGTGVLATAQRMHATHYCGVADRLSESQSTPAGFRWRVRASMQKRDLLAAGEYLLAGEPSDKSAALGMLGALSNLVDFSSEMDRTIELGRGCLADGVAPADHPGRAGALLLIMTLYLFVDVNEHIRLANEAIDVARAGGQRRVEAKARAVRALSRRDDVESLAAVEIAREVDDPAVLSMVLNLHGGLMIVTGTHDAEAPLLEALALESRLGDIYLESHVRLHLSAFYLAEGRYDDARGHLDRIFQISGVLDPFDPRVVSALLNLGYVELYDGQPAAATRWLLEGMSRARVAGMTALFRNFVLLISACALTVGRLDESAHLLGAASALEVESLRDYEAPLRAVRESTEASLREGLGDRFDAAVAVGEGLPANEVVVLAREFALKT